MAHVLVVDDDAAIRETLRLLLEMGGHTASESEDGQVALVALRTMNTPTVAIVDLMMPRMDGPALLRAIAADPILRSRHAYILLTANTALILPVIESLPQEFAQSLTLLHKPYESELLLLIVDQVAQKLAAQVSP